MNLTEMNLAEKKRSIVILLGVAALAADGYVVVSGILHYLPYLHNMVAADLIFMILLWLVMASAIPVCISVIRSKKLCFLRGFAMLYTLYNLLVMVYNLFSMVDHVNTLNYFASDKIPYHLLQMLPGLVQTGLSSVSGVLLFLGIHRKKHPFLIAAVCLAAAAFVLHLIEWRMVFHFYLFYLILAIAVLLHQEKQV